MLAFFLDSTIFSVTSQVDIFVHSRTISMVLLEQTLNHPKYSQFLYACYTSKKSISKDKGDSNFELKILKAIEQFKI